MFKSQNFCHIASNNRNQVKIGVFTYRTTDALETVLASGYFNERIIDINLHDLIIHEKVDNADATKVERNLLCVTERTLENVGTTLIKSKWEGDIETEIATIEQAIENLPNVYVKKDGTSVMSAPLKFLAGSMRGAVGPYLNGVSFWKMDSQGNITNIANITDSQFYPVTTNSIDLGNTTHTWKDAHVARVITAVLNNGYDIAVPVTASPDTLALKSEVDLAANSGRMITDQGVWYAKMYAGTTAPAAENGTNYADFSQTDVQGNPIIVIYERQNGAWVQSETITPPAEYDGYVPITSKIWDIAEQTGQQGGRILWNHQSKEFTPYPQIISFDGANITNGSFQGTANLSGTSIVSMPENPSGQQIVNKDYVDAATSGSGYHPDILDWKWADHQLNDVQWLRADTFSWQDGGVYEVAYQHLVDDLDAAKVTLYRWRGYSLGVYYYVYTLKQTPDIGDVIYSKANDEYWPTSGTVASVSGSTITSTISSDYLNYDGVVSDCLVGNRETIAGTTIDYYTAPDGHKICPASEESNVAAIYAATGVAWYYILDTDNQRFKLPRAKPLNGAIVGNGKGLGVTGTGSNNFSLARGSSPYPAILKEYTSADLPTTQSASQSGLNENSVIGLSTDPTKSGIIAERDNTDQHKYLYFYVGSFTQTALENTAGLNAELFNDKADVSALNTLAAERVGYCSFNTSTRVKISTTDQVANKNGWLIGDIDFNGNNKSCSFYINSIRVGRFGYSVNNGPWFSATLQMPIKQGQTYRYACDGTLQANNLYFYPDD